MTNLPVSEGEQLLKRLKNINANQELKYQPGNDFRKIITKVKFRFKPMKWATVCSPGREPGVSFSNAPKPMVMGDRYLHRFQNGTPGLR